MLLRALAKAARLPRARTTAALASLPLRRHWSRPWKQRGQGGSSAPQARAGAQAAAGMGKGKHLNKRPRLEPEVVRPADVTVHPERYEAQLAAKVARVRQMFADMDIPELEVFESPREHFRLRAEFRVWQSGNDIFYIMYEPAGGAAKGPDGAAEGGAGAAEPSDAAAEPSSAAAGAASEAAASGSSTAADAGRGTAAATSNGPAAAAADGGSVPAAAEGQDRRRWEKRRVDSFPVAAELVNELMRAVIAGVRGVRELRHRLFQANFHTTLSGEAMVTLIYHRQLDAAWEQAAGELRAALGAVPGLARGSSVSIVGRSKSQKVVLGEEWVTERLEVGSRTLSYRQVEGGFSQPNGHMCVRMLEWARGVTAGSEGRRLLELYCGNGNFTIALAPNFRSVFATEVSKASVAAAQHNLEANGVANVHVARLSSEEFTQAWRGEREFFRMKELPDVRGMRFQTVLVDPPRAGLDDKTVELVRQVDNIVYVSCNPETLHANLEVIGRSHAIERFAVADQFPYTDHIECLVYLTRRT